MCVSSTNRVVASHGVRACCASQPAAAVALVVVQRILNLLRVGDCSSSFGVPGEPPFLPVEKLCARLWLLIRDLIRLAPHPRPRWRPRPRMLYDTAIASSTPLAFVKQRLLFLTEAGAASLDLCSMTAREAL
ncbi:hypothetical protein ZWY2020_025858 [Hordeum vulgare]|nr:hypothetical protein ZWY2020_025858 [Hordeum vulgare]